MTGAEKDLLRAYEQYQRTRGLSPKTIRRRTISVGLFLRYVAPLTIELVTADLVDEWLGLIPVAATRRAYRSDLAMVFEWATRRRVCTVNPMVDVGRVRVPKGLPRPIDAALVGDLVRYAPDRETQLAVGLAAYAGLRCFEVAALQRGDISLHAVPPTLVVRHGKGDKGRVVPLHPVLAGVLEGLPAGPVVRIKADSLSRKVARYLRSEGLDATMHQLRHTFATELYRNTRDLLATRDLMGHESIQTTTVYTQLVGAQHLDAVAGMYGAVA